MSSPRQTFHIYPIGFVRHDQQGFYLEILPAYHDGLKDLAEFSHVVVLWWAHENDNPKERGILLVHPPHSPEHEMGVFATRAPVRPNPFGLTPCEILSLDYETGLIRIKNIDARENTPIIDLKAYYPTAERVKKYRLPKRFKSWPRWIPDEGLTSERQ